MKSCRHELWFETSKRREFINITRQVESCLQESGILEGLLLCNAMHITASVFINDDESGLHHDFEQWLEQLAPEKPHSRYRHNSFEDNADAHLKRTIMGREVVVAVSGGKLDLGPWEQIFYGEFDGKRKNGCWSRSSASNYCRSKSATFSTCGVWGNISTGCTSWQAYPMRERISRSRARVWGEQET